ncbi:MAG: response regulator [Deltaproteobacteria bacterium]|nr:response regulator [Deltaproteobacteria bacterium]
MAARILVVDDHIELATLLGTALEGRGHVIELAHSGEEALQAVRVQRPDAAVVDLLLPDMLGTDVIDALVASEPPIPVIAISGVFRGPSGSHAAVEEHGAHLFLEKPFSTKALLDGIADLVGATAEVPVEIAEEDAAEEALIELELSEAIEIDEEELQPTNPPSPPVAYEAPLTYEAPLPEPGPAPERRSAGKLARMGFVEDLAGEADPGPAPDRSARARLPRPPPEPATPTRPAARSGDLALTRVPRLIAAQTLARTTGSLVLRRGKATKAIYFQNGEPVYAASNLARDRLLSFAVRRGKLAREDAEAAMEIARETQKKTGQILLEMDVLDRDELTALVKDQLRSLLWSTFDWREGSYQQRPEKGTRSNVGMGLPLGRLVLQGIAETLSLEALQDWLPETTVLGPGTAPTVPLEELDLDSGTAHLLVAADGTKTVRDLLALAAPLPEREVLAFLAGLEALGILVTRDQMLTSLSRVGFLI